MPGIYARYLCQISKSTLLWEKALIHKNIFMRMLNITLSETIIKVENMSVGEEIYNIMKSFVKSPGSVSTDLRNSHNLLHEGIKLPILLTIIFPVPRTVPGYAMTTFE